MFPFFFWPFWGGCWGWGGGCGCRWQNQCCNNGCGCCQCGNRCGNRC